MTDPKRIVRVLGPRVLLKRHALPEQSRGGIFVLGREYPTLATVMLVGNKAAAYAQLLCGDEVYFNTFDWGKWSLGAGATSSDWAIFPVRDLYVKFRNVGGERRAFPLNNFVLVRGGCDGNGRI